MKKAFCLFIAVVFLFGAAVVHGTVSAGLQSIDCSNASSISFSIYIPDIDEWEGSTDQSSWSLNEVDDAACQPTFNAGSNLVTYSNINVDTCAPGDPETTPDKFEYKFVISVEAGSGSAIPPVTFAYDHGYSVKCLYNRELENLMASFEPLHSLTDSGSNVGADFAITFTVHFDDDDESQVNTYLYLRTAVYGKVLITDASGIPQNLDIHFREVTADTDNSPGGDEFTLVENGCPASAVVSNTECQTTGEDRFFFEVFRFPGQKSPEQVFLRAKVIVCLSNDMSSVCQSECHVCTPHMRKRRETREQVQQTEFYVTAGPFQIREPDQESEAAADKDEGTPLPAYVIAVVAVCGLLAVAIVSAVVLIVFRRRRQNVANVELKNEDSVTA